MKKFLIEDVKLGESEGGIACGPVGGGLIAEVLLRNTEDDTLTYHCLAEVEGTLNFYKSAVSTFQIQVDDDFEGDKEGWDLVADSENGGYSCYEEYFDALAEDEIDGDQALIWKLLVYLVNEGRGDFENYRSGILHQYLEDLEIPKTEAEDDYEYEKSFEEEESEEDDDEEEDEPVDPDYEKKLLDDIRAEFIGKKLDLDLFPYEDDGRTTPAGDYTYEETWQDADYNEFKCNGGYTLAEDGTITDIRPMTCRKLKGDDAAFCSYVDASAEDAYDLLRDELNNFILDEDDGEDE